MNDTSLHTENFLEEQSTIEEIINHLRTKKLKLLQELNVVENAIKYQTERLNKK